MIDPRLRDRYSRQTMFPGIAETGQAKLLSSSAVIIGCGGLGTNIATLLVRAGVGKVRIVDRDFVEYHNLHRQVLFNEHDVRSRLPKAIAAEHHLQQVNSSVVVQGIVADANYTNIEAFCKGADVILDGLDNAESRFLINDVALKHRIPWIYGGAVGASGMTMVIIPGESSCYRCIQTVLPVPGTVPTCETAGVIGPAPAVVGSLQATEAIKILVGAGNINRGLALIDLWAGTVVQVSVERRKDCPACNGKYEYLERSFEVRSTSLCGQSRSVQVIDTRFKVVSLEQLAARLENVQNISWNEYLLSFTAEEHDIFVFPDGRAIIKNTVDEELARQLYARYLADTDG